MKFIFTMLVVTLVLTAIGGIFYGGYLGLVYLWQIYAGLGEVIRIILLSAMATVMLAAFVIAGAIKTARSMAQMMQLKEPKLRLYQSLIEVYIPVFKASTQPSHQALRDSLDALWTDLQILSTSRVLDCHTRLEAAIYDRQPSKQIEELFQKLIKAIRRDLGHGTHYDETKLKILLNSAASDDGGRSSPGVSI